jgi:SAM-dependent methyltransferase
MQLFVRELADFYDSHLGAVARRVLLRRLRQIWPNVEGLRLLGYGYAVPYLRPFLLEAERGVAAMPAHIGVTAWPGTKCLTALVEEEALAFPDAFFDRVLVVHGMEGAESLRPLLRQLWRVLAPEGKLLLVVPNRASLWAQMDWSPFGQGRPFSRRELDRVLRDVLFEPTYWDRALYAPPFQAKMLVGTGAGWEKIGHRFFPGIGGVHLVEVTKSLYSPVKSSPAPKGAHPARLTPVSNDTSRFDP